MLVYDRRDEWRGVGFLRIGTLGQLILDRDLLE